MNLFLWQYMLCMILSDSVGEGLERSHRLVVLFKKGLLLDLPPNELPKFQIEGLDIAYERIIELLLIHRKGRGPASLAYGVERRVPERPVRSKEKRRVR